MRKISYTFFCFILFCIHTYAQENKTIITELNTYRPSQGTIIIYQDNVIDNMLGHDIVVTQPSTSSVSSQLGSSDESGTITTRDTKGVKTRGYRIQVYSGNDQRKSKDIAYSRKNNIKSAYPNMDVSISYTSPVWRVRAGSFRTRAEADQALKEMRSRFPAFGKEMHIIDDVITVYVNY